MNLVAGLLGYGGFVLAVLGFCAVCYMNGDSLERWARARFANRTTDRQL